MTDCPFESRVAAASLSGQSGAEWARTVAPHVGVAFLGGIALDDSSVMARVRRAVGAWFDDPLDAESRAPPADSWVGSDA